MSDQDYYSLPSERTADYFGNVNRTFPNGQSYHSGSLVWSLASMAVGPIAYIGYLIFN